MFVVKNAKKFRCTSRLNIVNSENMQAVLIANRRDFYCLIFTTKSHKTQIMSNCTGLSKN